MTKAEFKKKCIELRQRGLTLGELVKYLGRPKTSVYFHIRNLPLSQEKLSGVRKEHTIRINKFNHLRKGKSARQFTKFNSWSAQTVALVAHLSFDGELRASSCIYNNRNRALIELVKTSMRHIYDYKPIELVQGEVVRISYHNVALASYLKDKSQQLLKDILNLPLELKRTFLKAFYDDEGCMDFRKKRRQVRGYQHNGKILEVVHELLKDLGIESKVSRFHEIIISRKNNLEAFKEKINFSRGVRINGDRSNSIWKRSLEKRKILQIALNSYQ